MKILFCGDVVGRAGRNALQKHIPVLREQHKFDALVINGENSANGFGITNKTMADMLTVQPDCITSGDHIWDQTDCLRLLEQEPKLLRPANYPAQSPGRGFRIFELKNGQRLAVLHLLGQVFHKEYLDNPFNAADAALDGYVLGRDYDALLVDIHAEATAEKNGIGWHLDGRASAVVGSHTHVPTADARIMPKGTAYQTDAGMCGDYNSIIGFQPEVPMKQFTLKRRVARMEAATGEGTVCGALIETDDRTGLAKSITSIKVGGALGG